MPRNFIKIKIMIVIFLFITSIVLYMKLYVKNEVINQDNSIQVNN